MCQIQLHFCLFDTVCAQLCDPVTQALSICSHLLCLNRMSEHRNEHERAQERRLMYIFHGTEIKPGLITFLLLMASVRVTVQLQSRWISCPTS